MKNLIMGIVIGLSLAITPMAFSAYYSGSTSASDLTATELKSVIQDALNGCDIRRGEHMQSGKFLIDCY